MKCTSCSISEQSDVNVMDCPAAVARQPHAEAMYLHRTFWPHVWRNELSLICLARTSRNPGE
jgi:hypothetical protein